MSNLVYKNPISPIQVPTSFSVSREKTFGTNFSVLGVGGYMEVYNLSDLVFDIPVGQTGNIELTANTIPIHFKKGTGEVFSFDVLTLNSDNISTGRRRLGMLVYVYETKKIYQHTIDNYDALWSAATGSTGIGGQTVVISNFGTTVRNNTVAGQNFINAWTASTIEGIDGYTNTNATWRELKTGGGSGSTVSGDYLSLSGGTVTGNTIFQSGLSANTVYATNYQNLPIDPDTYVTGFTFDQVTYKLSLGQNTNNQYSALTANLAILASDVTITGGTYNQNTGVATFTNNSGGTFQVSGFTTGLTDTLVTAYTYNNNTFTIFNSNGISYGASFDSLTGLTINGDFTTTGNTSLQSLTATTISATTYSNLPNTLYTGDGILSSNRIVNLGSYFLSFSSSTNPDTLVLKSGNVGIGVSTPQYPLHIVTPECTIRLTNADAGGAFVLSGDTGIPRFDIGSIGSGVFSFGVVATGATASTYAARGKASDSYIRASVTSNGLNIINAAGASLEDYIRFYAGKNANQGDPDLHIQGTGTTRGFIGINVSSPTNRLHVTATTNPVRFVGITADTRDTNLLSIDSSGVLHSYPISSLTGSSSIFTGGTVSGPTNFTNGLSANTISATTYQNLPTDIRTTGATYSNNTFTFTNNTGGTFNVLFNTVTGLTVNGNITITGASALNGAISGSSLTGTTSRMVEVNSGGTISATRQIISAYLTSGGTVANLLDDTNNWDINGIYTGTTITGTYQGQKHYNPNYFFEAVADNLFIRLIRG